VTPARRLRFGVSGLGRAFTLMLPTFLRDPRVRLVAACDPREAARERFARDFGAKVYKEFEALARDDAVEVIYIASPHEFHAAQAKVAAAHGKHLLVEKPMALSLEDCDAMIESCRAAGVQLVVGHCHSFDAPYLRTRDLVLGGAYGLVRMIHALNYTDFLYRPRRPEELDTTRGGGVVFSQAAHQIDIVRMLAGSAATRVRAVTGRWDPLRPTEGAYAALLWFANGAFASVSYNGYGRFDSDEWCGWTGEMGRPKNPAAYGDARRRLAAARNADEEARLKAAGSFGGDGDPGPPDVAPPQHPHFGPIVVSCERADLRPVPDGVWIYADERREHLPLPAPRVPRVEVIDELLAAVTAGVKPLHDGLWARGTVEVCLALLDSARTGRDVELIPRVHKATQ
jgi:phthalate 4,5-cis-dihydrodiol dehydrogenase